MERNSIYKIGFYFQITLDCVFYFLFTLIVGVQYTGTDFCAIKKRLCQPLNVVYNPNLYKSKKNVF